MLFHKAVEGRLASRFFIACAPRRLTRRILGLRAVPSGTLINLRTSAYQRCGVVPRRARVEARRFMYHSNSGLERNNEEEDVGLSHDQHDRWPSRPGTFSTLEVTPRANRWFLKSTFIQTPPESGGICGRLS